MIISDSFARNGESVFSSSQFTTVRYNCKNTQTCHTFFDSESIELFFHKKNGTEMVTTVPIIKIERQTTVGPVNETSFLTKIATAITDSHLKI